MRSLYFILVWSIFVVKGYEIQEGEIEHYLEIVKVKGPLGIRIEAYFSTYNESLGVRFLLVQYPESEPDDWKIIPLGDAYQIHSFVLLERQKVSVLSSAMLESSNSLEYGVFYPHAFAFRNLIFLDNAKFIWSQQVMSLYQKVHDLCDKTVTAQFDWYFQENSTICDIKKLCFEGDQRCGIDRDTGELELLTPETQYMYKVFNFTIPWNCAYTFCTFKDTDDNEFVIPKDLRTSSDSPAEGERIGLVPLLTTQSKFVRRKLRWLVDDSFTQRPAMLISIGFLIVFWFL
ncbi:unnamed protein product [Bursaphelenchus okinawaensis]|uniref:Uncharacterized protein n=1 Tax=Bursaphelenchus okinawaensis TaxID=465554 RepID=A0A811JQE3_9BILA|nr:unnamed protein product [Bursaphelenchus okinawaensis]CAG9077444.1 unnamed protein product [Bursaphelenchus okinawaensis]